MLYSIFELTVVLVLATSLHIAPLSNVVSAIIKAINIACFIFVDLLTASFRLLFNVRTKHMGSRCKLFSFCLSQLVGYIMRTKQSKHNYL